MADPSTPPEILRRSGYRAENAGVFRVSSAPWSCLWATLALAASGLPSAHAAAQAPAAIALVWNAPAECPDRAALLARVGAHDPAASSPRVARISVHADVTQIGARYRLVLRLQGADGVVAQRALDGDDCNAVADAAALLIALALEHDEGGVAAAPGARAEAPSSGEGAGGVAPGTPAGSAAGSSAAGGSAAGGSAAGGSAAGRSGAASAPATGPGPTSARQPLIVLPPDNQVLPRSRPIALAFGAFAAFGVDAGMLPHAPALGPLLRLQLQVDQLRAQAGLGWWLARRGRADYASAELEGSGVVGSLSLGVDWLRAPLTFGPVAVFELGRLWLEAHNITSSAPASATWVGAGAGVHLGYPIAAGFEATFELAALFPFARPRWLLHTPMGAVGLFSTSPAVLRVATGFGYVFQ